jgi:hypothetical protein
MGNVKAIHLFVLGSLFASAFAGCASSKATDDAPSVDQTIPRATKWGTITANR